MIDLTQPDLTQPDHLEHVPTVTTASQPLPMTTLETMLREENDALREALEIINKKLTQTDGVDPEAWWLELTADEVGLIRAVIEKYRSEGPALCVKSDAPWPPLASVLVECCPHGTPKGYLCQKCPK